MSFASKGNAVKNVNNITFDKQTKIRARHNELFKFSKINEYYLNVKCNMLTGIMYKQKC